jgi:cobalamin biosynthesis protein cobD
MDWYVALLPLVIGWVLDMIFGDPVRLPHPVVWFGKVIASCEHKFNQGNHRVVKGAVVAVVLIAGTYAVVKLFVGELSSWPWVKIAVESLLVFYCLAGTTLCREVRMVFEAVDRSVEDGRRQVGRIVGRDTSQLNANEIRIAALETLAENLSDGVIAPLFWYMLLGVPGMVAYKMVNTLDSMIGYRTARYREFGRWAARIDDIANYIPARLTAVLMIVAAGKPQLLGFVFRYGKEHASPNSGYPEAALAGILNCRFGGTHCYFGETVYKPYIGENERNMTTADMIKAVAINRRAEIMAVALAAVVRLFL